MNCKKKLLEFCIYLTPRNSNLTTIHFEISLFKKFTAKSTKSGMSLFLTTCAYPEAFLGRTQLAQYHICIDISKNVDQIEQEGFPVGWISPPPLYLEPSVKSMNDRISISLNYIWLKKFHFCLFYFLQAYRQCFVQNCVNSICQIM